MVPAASATTRGECAIHTSVRPCALGKEGTVTSFHSGDTWGCFQGSSPQSSWAGCQAGNIQSTE